jgi:hypothetical protein
MLTRLKQYFFVALAMAIFYFLLSHHFIFYSFHDFDLLNKKELTLAYTFYSIRQHTALETLRIEPLRNAGIENILLDRGMISESRLDQILNRIDKEK